MGKKGGGMEPRKGLKRKYFLSAWSGQKDWSGKPGFRREAPEMRPKKADKNSYAFILLFLFFRGG
jgi:hypothetical protein